MPISRLFAGGEPNEEMLRIVRANVRTPFEVADDLYAQAGSNELVHGALAKVFPERVLAQAADSLWNIQITDQKTDSEPFTYVFFSGGGMCARPGSDGLSATAFPSGIRGVPAEVIESISPVVMHKRELRPDSEGAGRHRGGLGQEMERSSKPW